MRQCKLSDMSRPIGKLEVDINQHRELDRIAKSHTSSLRDILRARIILERGRGLSLKKVSEKLGVRRRIASKWCIRFERMGMAGLKDAKGRGRPMRIPETVKEHVITEAVLKPPNKNRWSIRSMGKHLGISDTTVQRLWKANDIKPHHTRTFKLFKEKEFISRLLAKIKAICLDYPIIRG